MLDDRPDRIGVMDADVESVLDGPATIFDAELLVRTAQLHPLPFSRDDDLLRVAAERHPHGPPLRAGP